MNTRTTWTLLLVLLLLAPAESLHAQWRGTVRDSAGVQVISNTRDGLWASGTAWTVVQELRIGTIDEDPDYMFGQIGFIAVGADGRIFVLDAQAQHVKVYSPDGEYLQTIGGPGGGPGELGLGAVFLTMVAGDTLFVPDLANRRVNRYGPDGSEVGSFPLAIEQGIPMQWRSTGTGLVAEQVRPLTLPDNPAPDSMDVIVLLGTDGAVTDTLMRFPSGKTFDFSGGRPEFHIYSPEPIWTLTDDGRVLFGVNDEYRIGVYGPGAKLERIVSLPFERGPVGDRDKKAVIDFFEKAWRDAGVPANAISQLRSGIHFSDYFPAFASIQVGPGGSLWIQHIQAASELSEEELESYNLLEDAGAPEWDVFDREGRYLGIVRMPSRFAPRLFVEDKIYGVWRDEWDVQYMVRLRIEGAN